MAIQPTDFIASIAKITDRDTIQQAKHGAPVAHDETTLRQLAEAKRKQVRQVDDSKRVEPRRDANQEQEKQGHGSSYHHLDTTDDEEHHFDALA